MSKSNQSSRLPIAVVGVSALFPGSLDATGFWKDILEGSDLITDVPPSHWLIDDYYDPDPSVPDKTYAKRGAFLKDIDFDSLGWGVPPNLVPETDTAQLLALIVAQRVLEDACNQSSEALKKLDRSNISVILGVTSGQELLGSMVSRLQRPVWVKALRDSGLPEAEVQAVCDRISDQYTPWRESTFPGLLGNVVAGRIANRLDLGGTNCVTDAACASTFSALSMAVNELYLGDSDMVITGGVDAMNDIFMFMCFSKTPALSPTGDCRPFSDQADGTMLGEGLGMVALKRLEDAERDGDRIYAVINAVGSSSDGRAKSVYAPLPEGQARALRRTYAQTDFGPEQVELVEAHGTGTKAGDAAEFKGLTTAFSESGREDMQWCAIGSVKSQIGHTKAASAAAGLFKAVMALHHKVLPPTIKVERPNPLLEIEQSPFHLSTQTRPWVRDSSHPRRASVSSFGFGGSNFHIAMTEYTPKDGVASRPAKRLRALGSELVTLSGGSPDALVAEARSRASESSKSGYLQWLARTSQLQFDPAAPVRLAVVANDEADLAVKLEQAATSIDSAPAQSFSTPTGIYYGTGQGSSVGDLAYLFSGQGSQYLHMGASVAMHFASAIEPWDRAADFKWDGTTRLHHVVFPRTAFEDEEKASQASTLSATEWAQPAIGCTSLSLLRLLDGLGLQADCFAGHSFGEVTALHAAGVLSEKDFLAVARRRGELMAQAAVTPGAMTAVSKPIEEIRDLLAGWDSRVVIANHNAPQQVVLSGETDEIEAVEAKLAEQNITARRLPVATAFHSPVVEKASGAFGEYLAEVEFSAPAKPVYSNTTGAVHDPNPNTLRAKLAEQLACPVKFVDMIESMYAAGVRSFVEVGPGSVLTGLVGRILEDRPHAAVNLDRKGRDGVRSFFEAIARLSVEGHALDYASLWSDFVETENPHDRAEPKLKIPINGSNYGKPYPPQGGTAALPGPNPPRKEKEIETVYVEVPRSESDRATAQTAAPAVVDPTIVDPTVVAPTIAGQITQSTAPAPAAASPGWAQAYQEAQRHTAEAHAAYMQAMAQTHTAYLDTIERSFQSFSVQAGLQPAATAAPVVQPIQAPIAAPLSSPIAAAPVVQPAIAVAQPMPTAPAFVTPPVVQSVPPAVAPVAAPEVEPPAVQPEANRGGVDLHALLLEVVSDKTGYPPEMLNMEMELEADLGIDSIKRVEILSAMNDLAPGLPEVDTAVMAKLATLGQVVEYLNGQLGRETSTSPNRASAADEAASDADDPPVGAGLGRYVLAAVEQPAIGMAQNGLFGEGQIIVTDEGTGLAQQVAEALETRGVSAVAVTQIPAGDLRGVVFLGGLREVSDDLAATRVNREAFEVARAVAERFEAKASGEGVFVTLQDTGGNFGTGDFAPARAWLAGCAGLARTVAQEWPGVSVKAIDLERAGRSGEQLASAIADELVLGGPDLDVGLSASGRRVVLRSQPVEVVRGTPVLGDGDVVVASGGARGVTATTLIGLASEAALRFVLLGRTELAEDPPCCHGVEGDAALKRALLAHAVSLGEKLTPVALGKQVGSILASREVRDTVSQIEKAGSQARYMAVDVTSLESVSAALTEVRADWGDIAAIVHGAGVIADKRITEKTGDQFDRVFDTKVEGLRTLLAATADDPIALLCFFSSVAARCGNVGQVDYAMANEVLNKVAVAEFRRRNGACLVKSLGWGPWEGGMVSPQLKAHFESMGVPLIPLGVGAKMLVDEVAGSAPEQIELVLGGEPKAEALAALSDPELQGRSFSLSVVVGDETHPYLADHAIKGTPVVPIAMVIEWFSRCAKAFGPELVLERLSELKVLRGISLREFAGGCEHLVVHARQLTNGSGATVALELADRKGGIYYRCTAELATERGTSQSHVVDEQELALGSWGEAEIYDGELLFHGPAFQVIQNISGISERGMVAELSGVEQSSWADERSNSGKTVWITDPLAFDGGLQLALLWCKHVLGGASLPTGINEIRTWADAPTSEPIRCTLTGRSAVGSKSVSDLVFHDASGNLLAEFIGVETHLLPSQEQA
ncbi:MAG: SDR family NAD(P)-dependent oxidoreductase [Myxococcales bacterium]|nr:SDR family NAD(P)-dependent oxidoreductase [Myxococcales bacterium]